ncbi:MAG: hypothetical protein EXR71_07975 [Myxococcales bacterium]|nr:hypothetical protein [Myxococcales bacterium]
MTTLLSALLACTGLPPVEKDESLDDLADHRVADEAVGELGANQSVWSGAEFTVEPGADVMTCVFGSYMGPTVGLHDVHTHQGAGGHHLQIMGTTTPLLDVPDGEVMDCTGDGGQFQMADLEPIGVTNGGSVNGEAIGVSMPLAEGMAVRLEEGQRYVLQSHYINTGQEAFKVRDLAVLTTIPEEEVVTWAAPLIYNDSDFSIPPAGELTTSFECTTEKQWNFLYVLGHMHEWGTAFSIDRQDGADYAPFYNVPVWDPVFRDAPAIDYYPDGSLSVPEGTTFRTTCSWFNDQDEALVFPHEMCVAVNIVYPQKTTVICDAG